MTGDTTAIETETVPVRRPGSLLAGRPISTISGRRQLELARHHGRRALLVGIRRLTKFLADPTVPVDLVYLRAFTELASRCGLPAQTSQVVDATSINATIGSEQIETIARQLMSEVLESERDGS